MSSSGHPAAAQRSDGGAEACAAEQSGDAQGTRRESGGGGSGGLEEWSGGVGLPSQNMQVKGAQGNHTRSLPVSRKRDTGAAADAGPTDRDSV
jgi:hypothetical protein